jgi:hypothetical protein
MNNKPNKRTDPNVPLNPDQNPTREKGPVHLPGKAKVEKEILNPTSQDQDETRVPGQNQRLPNVKEPGKKSA